MRNVTRVLMAGVALALASTVSAQPALKCQLGILDLDANGGINPTTEEPWKAGDQYRLAFVVSAANPLDPNDKTIDDFNAHIQSVANASVLGTLGGATWKVIGSTVDVNARANTSTHPVNDGPGHAVFRLDSAIIARDYAQLWSGALRNPLNRTQHNQHRETNPNYAMYPYSGTNQNGTTVAGQELGRPSGQVARAGASDRTDIWLNGGGNYVNHTQGSYYGLSEPLTITGPAVTVISVR